MLKKILIFALTSVAICNAVDAKEKMTAVTTFTVIADIAKNVAGDAANVLSITKPGAEIHEYEPTPQDLMKAQKADLLLWNGLNLEMWFQKFYANLKDVPSVLVTEGIEPMPIHGGDYDGKPNPHAWMAIASAKIYVDNIARAFAKHDPENAAVYQENARLYKQQIDAMGAKISARVAAIPKDQRWLVTSEGAFSYLARDLGFKEAFLWPINSDQQGSPQQVKELIDLVRKNDIKVVFSESTISDKPIKQVASETDAKYGGVLYVDSLSEANGNVPTYLELLNVTTDTILQGFE